MIAPTDALLLSISALLAAPSIWSLKPYIEAAAKKRLAALPLFEQKDYRVIKEAESPLEWLSDASRFLLISGSLVFVYFIITSESSTPQIPTATATNVEMLFYLGAIVLFGAVVNLALIGEFLRNPQTWLLSDLAETRLGRVMVTPLARKLVPAFGILLMMAIQTFWGLWLVLDLSGVFRYGWTVLTRFGWLYFASLLVTYIGAYMLIYDFFPTTPRASRLRGMTSFLLLVAPMIALLLDFYVLRL